MPFSPEEIKSKDFLVALRGYDKLEVASFLQDVASQHADLLAEVALARGEGRSESGPATDSFADLGDQVASVMRAAAEAAAQLQTETEREAASIRAAAGEEAGRAAAEARLELDAASELRAEAEREAAQTRAAAREEADRTSNEARQLLEAAKEARSTVEREAKELRESTIHHEQELRIQAEQTVEHFVASAREEIEEAVKQVLGGFEGLQQVEQRSLSLTDAVPPGSGESVGIPPASASEESNIQDEDAAASAPSHWRRP
jgi:DivIVA domain-containing protein